MSPVSSNYSHPGRPSIYYNALAVQGVSADTAYCMVDLSTTDQAHNAEDHENGILLWGYDFDASQTAATTQHTFTLGPLLESDGTNGTVAEAVVWYTNEGAGVEGIHKHAWFPEPIVLVVVSGALVGPTSLEASGDYTTVDTGETLVTPGGTDVVAAAGDLLLVLDETGGAETIDFHLGVWISLV